MLQRMMALALIAYSILLLQGKPATSSIEVPSDTQLLMKVHGQGAQVYACTDQHWTLKAPDAQLIDDHKQVVGTHFAGPTWRLEDGSEVKGKMVASQPSTKPGTVPWLLVEAVPGSASGKLASVRYIQRTETEGGAAPAGPCTAGETRVPYEATYGFYAAK